MLLLLAVSSLIGLAAIAGIWRPDFLSPIGRLLPDWILDTTYGGEVAYRSVGRSAYFFDLPYFRVDSLFLFPNQFGVFILATFPTIVWFSRRLSKGTKWLLAMPALALALLNMLATTGRVTVLAFGVGGLSALSTGRVNKHGRLLLLVVGITALMGGAVLALSPPIRGGVDDFVRSVVYARGPGAVTERLAVYGPTLDGIVSRPIFGWGTERDIEGEVYPAGSHRYYLAVVYRHGFVGFFLWSAMVWMLIRETRLDDTAQGGWIMGARRTRIWLLVGLGMLSISIVPDLDASVFAVIWLGLSILLAVPRLDEPEVD